MPGSFGNFKNRKNIAYTLAEVLVVMTIIMLIILALPPVTKKVFKIKDTRKAHGRYECYWKVNGAGEKELHSFVAEENGREEDKNLGTSATYCDFQPTANSIYFIMHAVGGGGAGAIVYTRDIDNGDGTFTTANVSDLEPKQENVQAISYITASNPNAWPSWIKWANGALTDAEKPWGSADRYDVDSIETKQMLRYRTSGTPGSIVSTFLPQLPGNVTLRIYPGRGGEISKTESGSGGDGEDTKIMYIYDGKAPIEGLLARGGAGGNGSIDSKITYTLVGGPSTDFDLTSMASINGKYSGFIDVIEGMEKYDRMQTKVPDNAGDSGNGETQYIKDTNGQIIYEHDDNGGIIKTSRRFDSNWQNITDKVKTAFFRRPYFTTEPKCSLKTISSPIEVKREGYCDIDLNQYTATELVYICGIGKIPSGDLNDLSKASDPGNGGDWKRFTVKLPSSFNGTSFVYGTPVIENNPAAYDPATAKYYNCTFDTSLMTITCNTRIDSGKVYVCEQSGKDDCANGLVPKSRSKESTTYTNGSDNLEMKCPASGGGDGAVVILW